MRALTKPVPISYVASQPIIVHASLPARAASRKAIPGFNLSDFLLRQRVVALWRDILRMTNSLPKETSMRQEMKSFARDEFERNKHVTDPVQIRYLVSTGKTQLDQMKRDWRI